MATKLMIASVYDAFRQAGVEDSLARAASEDIAGYDTGLNMIERKIDGLDGKIAALGARLDAKIDALGVRLDGKIDALHGKVDALGVRLDGKIGRTRGARRREDRCAREAAEPDVSA